MVKPLRHRQTKEAATDMFDLKPLRHTSTLPTTPFPTGRRFRFTPRADVNAWVEVLVDVTGPPRLKNCRWAIDEYYPGFCEPAEHKGTPGDDTGAQVASPLDLPTSGSPFGKGNSWEMQCAACPSSNVSGQCWRCWNGGSGSFGVRV